MIIEVIGVLFGLFFLIAGYIYGYSLFSFIPSAVICVLGLVGLVMNVYYNTYVALIEDYNGKKVFRMVKAKKFYTSRKDQAGYYLKIETIKKTVPYPGNNFINLNLSGLFREVICFLRDGDKLTPCNINFDLDNVRFISDSMIANHYQMMDIIRETVKPPADAMQTIINIGLMLLMLACIITMIYNSGKLGLNVGVINEVVAKIDSVMLKLEEMITKLEGGIGNIGGMVNGTISGIPPVTVP